jgi:hypothetical protein
LKIPGKIVNHPFGRESLAKVMGVLWPVLKSQKFKKETRANSLCLPIFFFTIFTRSAGCPEVTTSPFCLLKLTLKSFIVLLGQFPRSPSSASGSLSVPEPESFLAEK